MKMGYFSRRRSFLIKLVVVVSTAWFTIAFLLYSENRQPVRGIEPEIQVPVAQAIKRDFEKIEKVEKVEIKDNEIDKDIKDDLEPIADVEGMKREEEAQEGVLKIPGNSYGEMGKPVILPKNLTKEIKKVVDEGWSKNAFNQYASDLISIHRSLPDPRDEW